MLPKGCTQTCPALVVAVLAEFLADHLHGLIGEDGDEEVAVAALFELMIDWAHTELGFEAAEDGF